jgi:hypothetical protein
MKFKCPSCKSILSMDAAAAGLKASCPSCNISLVVPPVPEPRLKPALRRGKAVLAPALAVAGVCLAVGFIVGRMTTRGPGRSEQVDTSGLQHVSAPLPQADPQPLPEPPVERQASRVVDRVLQPPPISEARSGPESLEVTKRPAPAVVANKGESAEAKKEPPPDVRKFKQYDSAPAIELEVGKWGMFQTFVSPFAPPVAITFTVVRIRKGNEALLRIRNSNVHVIVRGHDFSKVSDGVAIHLGGEVYEFTRQDDSYGATYLVAEKIGDIIPNGRK